MGLFNSLYSGASGMLAQTRATSFAADNIANVSTTGYKRSDAHFADLLRENGRSSSGYVPGGVGVTEIARIREQGNIQQTTSNTDLSVVGQGFFTVQEDASGTGDFLYTRAGQFSEDAAGILRNSAGYYLYGYTTDTDGVAQGSGEGSLVPIDLSIYETQFFETDTVDLAINLNAGDAPRDPHLLPTAQQLPVDNLQVSYSRGVRVFDDMGAEHDLNFEFRRTIGPMAHFTSNTGVSLGFDDGLVDDVNGPTPGIMAGDQFVVSNGTDTLSVDFVSGAADTSLNQANTARDVTDVINNFTDANGDRLFLARLTDESRLLVQSLNPASTLDISGSSATVLGTTGLNIPQDPDAVPDYIYEPDYDITGAGDISAYPGQSILPALDNIDDPNPYSWWELTVSSTDALGNDVNVVQGLLNFDGDARLNAVTDADGRLVLNLDSANLPFNSTGGISVDMTRITQFDGNYDTLEAAQNGAPVGVRSGVEITSDGTVVLEFGEGILLPVYKIPLAVFANPDGLVRVEGTAFRVPIGGESGLANYVDAQSNGGGTINAATLESSTVDIAQEFSNLIVHQRAYSLNSQVVQAANEMTQNLSRLKG